MILSLIAWLAMWGQGQTPNCELLKSGHVLCADFRLVKPSKPAEHVIEIKTVPVKSDQTYHPPKGFEMKRMCDPGYEAMVPVANHLVKDHAYVSCVKVTRELWIDGAKFGVIKGLDDH
jgi:hypothetical protein